MIYPGVGPIVSTDTEEKLYWYQWVSVVLLIQGLFFYAPHGIWKSLEKNTIKSFVEGFGFAEFLNDSAKEKLLDQVCWIRLSKFTNTKYFQVKSSMVHRIPMMKFWANSMIFCELLNLINVITQWLINDWFLKGSFSKLGSTSYNPQKDDFNPLDIYFPKVAKCTYYKFGHTGEIINLDILCVLTQNIMHEKIYQILWYWYVFLIIATVSSNFF